MPKKLKNVSLKEKVKEKSAFTLIYNEKTNKLGFSITFLFLMFTTL